MTQVLTFAVAYLPKKHSCNHRLYQSQPQRHRTAANAFLTASHAKGGAQVAHLEVYCQSQQGQHAHAHHKGPDISRLDPALQQQWDHAANAPLGDMDIKPYSNRKVWWTCDQCPDGHRHSWLATVASRTSGTGCSQCSGRKVCKHNSLATKAPLIAAQWDYEANAGTPDDVVAYSSHMAHWHCKVCGHKWKATPCVRVRIQTFCKQCGDDAKRNKRRPSYPTFAECKHHMLAEWDHERNAAQGYYPDKVRLGSRKQIFWLCGNCPEGQEHSWSAAPYNRTGLGRCKTGCPVCGGKVACRCNYLQALYPDVAAQWDYSKNQGRPSDYPASSHRLAWWSSPQRASWQVSINSRTNQASSLGPHRSNPPSTDGFISSSTAEAMLTRVQERQVSAGRKPGLTDVFNWPSVSPVLLHCQVLLAVDHSVVHVHRQQCWS